MKGIVLLLCVLHIVFGRKGFGPTDQEWGHVEVRDGASLFWWLHYTTANVEKYTDRPLIIWIQGGPGGSGTGYGNFAEIGPLDINLNERNSSWVKHANILFVDNPVGVGFGYVKNVDNYAKNNTQIAKDFLVFLKQFYETLPEFKTVPLYIFCESYGGKMTAEIALVIDTARKNGEIESNLKGVTLGDSWISPADSVLGYAPYLLNLGIIDRQFHDDLIKLANQLRDYIDKDQMKDAYDDWTLITELIQERTNYVDFYNVLTKIPYDEWKKRHLKGLKQLSDFDETILTDLMNNKVAAALNLTQEWQYLNEDVYDALVEDFLRPVTGIVEKLLNETDVTVAVYNGQLDLIVDTPGTVGWIEKLNFKDKDLWNAQERESFGSEYYEGYVQKSRNFAMYWVERAGHMVPADNPAGMEYILKDVTNNFKV